MNDDNLRLVQAGYEHAAEGWATGAERAYLPMAAALLEATPTPLTSRTVLDVGAGTGALARLAARGGAQPIAVDASWSMLAHDAALRPPACVGDVLRLPLRTSSVDGAAAAFVLNHLDDPVTALIELARVVRPGGFVLASVFSSADRPPAKEAIDAALVRAGWEPPAWYRYLKTVDSQLGSVAAMHDAAHAAGLREIVVTERRVATGLDDPASIVEFRLSQPQVSTFLASASDAVRHRVEQECIAAVAATGQELSPGVVILAATC